MSRPSVEPTALFLPESEELADVLTTHCCLRNCMGHRGRAAGCCTLGGRDYIIGPIPDAAALLERLSERMGRTVAYEEVFVDFEEGAALFPERPVWQEPRNYPAIRTRADDPARPCIFLADDNLCAIHAVRSVTCRNYACDHVKGVVAAL